MPRTLSAAVVVCAAATAAGLLAACVDPAPAGDRVCGREEQRWIPLYQDNALDLIFIVDRSPSMTDEQTQLAASAPLFGRVLQQVGPLDLHVGVVSSDLGGGGQGLVTGCGAGPGGRFQGGARCGLPGEFLEWRTYDAGLEDAFSCLLDLPLSTCPVSQPIAALVHALDGTQDANDGFRREGAFLMAVFITDGDDCSLIERAALVGLDTEAEVDARCASLGEPPLASVRDSIDWLRGDDPRNFFAALISGPAPRLDTLSNALPERFFDVDIESPYWEDVFSPLGGTDPGDIGPCFDRAIDLEPTVPGVQAECEGTLRTPAGSSRLPWCSEPGASPPCMRAYDEPQACPFGAVVEVDLGDERIIGGASAEIRCGLPCE